LHIWCHSGRRGVYWPAAGVSEELRQAVGPGSDILCFSLAHRVTPCCILPGIMFLCLLHSQVSLHSTESIVPGSKPWLQLMYAGQCCPWTDQRASAVAHATSIGRTFFRQQTRIDHGSAHYNNWPCSCFSPDALPQHQQSPSCWLSCDHGLQLHVLLESPLRLTRSHSYTFSLFAGRPSSCCARSSP